MTIIDALRSPDLLGNLPAFRDLTSWRAWCVLLVATFGLPFSALAAVGVTEAEALATFARHTGRATYDPPAGGWAEVTVICGVQSGKSQIASVVATYAALTGEPGTTACVVAQGERSALRSIWKHITAPWRIPAFAADVVTQRSDEIELTRGRTLAVFPCRPASLRGVRASVVVLDELAFYRNAEGNPTDLEMLRAARGRVAMTAGKVISISSPYAQTGVLYEAHKRHWGGTSPDVLVWVGSAPDMNPTLPADYLRRMETEDPDAFRAEVLGEFRAGLSLLLDPDALAAVVERGVKERPPCPWRGHVASYDPSGGRVDAAALTVAHRHDGIGVVDCVRAWPAPHDPAAAIADAAGVLKTYGVTRVSGDHFGAEFTASAFKAHGIHYEATGRDRSALYAELLPLVNARRCVLLDDAATLRELRALERRRGTSGRDRIDHPRGGHDDRAVTVAGALVAAVGSGRSALTGLVW